MDAMINLPSICHNNDCTNNYNVMGEEEVRAFAHYSALLLGSASSAKSCYSCINMGQLTCMSRNMVRSRF